MMQDCGVIILMVHSKLTSAYNRCVKLFLVLTNSAVSVTSMFFSTWFTKFQYLDA